MKLPVQSNHVNRGISAMIAYTGDHNRGISVSALPFCFCTSYRFVWPSYALVCNQWVCIPDPFSLTQVSLSQG